MRTKKSAGDTRRAVLAVVLVLLSLVGHSAVAGSLPTLTAVIAGAVVAGAISWAVLGQRRSFTSLAVILFAGQLLMHAVTVAVGHHGVSYLPDLKMTASHLLAAAIVAALFAFGENAVATWRRAASRMLGVLAVPETAIEFSGSRQHAHTPASCHPDSVDVDTCPHRGPPIGLGAPTFA